MTLHATSGTISRDATAGVAFVDLPEELDESVFGFGFGEEHLEHKAESRKAKKQQAFLENNTNRLTLI